MLHRVTSFLDPIHSHVGDILSRICITFRINKLIFYVINFGISFQTHFHRHYYYYTPQLCSKQNKHCRYIYLYCLINQKLYQVIQLLIGFSGFSRTERCTPLHLQISVIKTIYDVCVWYKNDNKTNQMRSNNLWKTNVYGFR